MEEQFISQEELNELAAQMAKKNQAFLEGRHFDIKAEKTEKVVFVTVTLRNEDLSFYYPVELRINYIEEELLPRKAALHLVDYADLYYEDYLVDGEELFLPIDWTKHEYDTVEFQMRGQILNKKLESMADELLAQAEKELS